MKKSKRYLIAGLAIIAVTASSTLAYFTSTATIGNTDGGTNPLALNITNGKVEITANPGAGGSSPNWTYDVARESSKPAYSALDAAGITAYEGTNRSIDMLGLGGAKVDRWPIGAPVTGAVTLARPGDAFVMGTAVEGGDTSGANTGLNITNSSTLTVKVNFIAKTDANATDTFAALLNAGWKFYAGKQGGLLTEYTSASDLATGMNTILNAETWTNGHAVKLDIRLELPLTTIDDFQSDAVVSGDVTSFNLNNLFTIKATQENNPKWNNAGTV